MENARGLVAQYANMPLAGQPAGSPFRTGALNNIYPQFKRLVCISYRAIGAALIVFAGRHPRFVHRYHLE